MRIRRKSKGSAIAEFGPSMWLIMMIGVFPMLDLLALSLMYSCGLYATYLITNAAAVSRPASIVSPPNATPATFTTLASNSPEVQNAWKAYTNSCLGLFSKQANASWNFKITYYPLNIVSMPGGGPPPNNTMPYGATSSVLVKGTMSLPPIAPDFVKGFGACPGINTPIVFSYGEERSVEYTGVL